MFQREIIIIASLAVGIFLLVAGTGGLLIEELHGISKRLIVETLPGLVDTGLAQEKINDNRILMREMLAHHTTAERAEMVQMVRSNSTELLWRKYANENTNGAFSQPEWQNYQTVLQTRSNYLDHCEQFYGLILLDQTNAAAALLNGEASQSYAAYHKAVSKLFIYNAREGVSRGEAILQATRYVPWVIGGFCALVFFLGFMLGIRFAFSGGQLFPRDHK
jgi:hypothetical protein